MPGATVIGTILLLSIGIKAIGRTIATRALGKPPAADAHTNRLSLTVSSLWRTDRDLMFRLRVFLHVEH